jgi:hypothetical protein
MSDLDAVAELMGQIVKDSYSPEEAAESVAGVIYQFGLTPEDLEQIKLRLNRESPLLRLINSPV